ncbi:MAG: hypothetical protein AAFR74_06825, partial [Pseudomonadota bacterium]
KRDEGGSDAMKVIDEDDGEGTSSADAEGEKPKRRRSYSRKSEAAEEDGVMKTLSRGAESEAVAEAD